jgi:hypothetical protein
VDAVPIVDEQRWGGGDGAGVARSIERVRAGAEIGEQVLATQNDILADQQFDAAATNEADLAYAPGRALRPRVCSTAGGYRSRLSPARSRP